MKLDLAAMIGRYSNVLTTLDHLLAKGAEHIEAAGVSDDDMLEWRLAPDMFPLRSQAQFVINLASQWAGRAARLTEPPTIDGASGLADLRAAIVEAKAYLMAISPGLFEGRDDELLEIDLGELRPVLPIGQWVAGFATTNVHFHLSIAYAILRSHGVQLGKRDLFAGGL